LRLAASPDHVGREAATTGRDETQRHSDRHKEEAIVSANPTSNQLRRAWRRAIKSLPANRSFPEIRNFGRFCERRGVGPSAFGEAEVSAFAGRLFERGYDDAAKRARALRHQLNAARASPEWPGPPVTAPTPPERTRVHRPLSAFTPAFQQALADLERELQNPSTIPPDRAHGVKKSSTAAKYAQRARESASELIDLGKVDPAQLTTPAQLFTPDRLSALITRLQTRVAPTHVRSVAKSLLEVCRVYRPRGSAAEGVLLEAMRSHPAEATEIDGTPTDTLLCLLDSDAQARLTAFPDTALAQAAGAPAALARRGWSKAAAVVVIALSAPLRAGEIARLRVGDVAPNGKVVRVKAPQDPPERAYPLTATAASYLQRHLENLPSRHPDAPLLPGTRGGGMSAQSLTTLVENYVQPSVELPVTPDVLYLRHLALLLRDDPGRTDRVMAWARLSGAPFTRQRLRLLAQLFM
jgi:hypothetical protein